MRRMREKGEKIQNKEVITLANNTTIMKEGCWEYFPVYQKDTEIPF